MRHVFLLLLAAGFCACDLPAQEDLIPQFHGFATQAFVYSGGGNNYLGMNTSSGSASWSEAALNVNDQVTDKLRIGVQFHMTKLGQFGDANVAVDWALGDYKINRWMGVRGGKVKIRWGLYNDVQDADPGYLWSLLPEPIYAVDWRATNLSQYGVELYGKVPLAEKLGELGYSVYYGDYFYSSNDGYAEGFKEAGLNFTNPASGKTPGIDLRWKTPLSGLLVGGSLMVYNATGNLVNGTYTEPFTYWPTYYAAYEKRKLFLSAQYMTLIQHANVILTGQAPSPSVTDTRAWFVMGGYHLTDKLQAGVYYTNNTLVNIPDESNPANYYHDWVASCRYDINSYFYLKTEMHFISGTGLGFYTFNNPNGLNPQTKVLVAKIGFSF